MQILHDTHWLLELHSPAAASKHIFVIMTFTSLGVSEFAALSIILGIAYLMLEMPAAADFLSGGGLFGFCGFLGTVFGFVGLRTCHDMNLRFDGDSECLIVSHNKTERRIPFGDIIKAEVFDDGSDSVVYALRIVVRDSDKPVQPNDRDYQDDAKLKAMADKINSFLRMYRPDDVSINLADADLATMAKGIVTNLWHGTPAAPASPPASVTQREGAVWFVCPECGKGTDDVCGPPPYECRTCRQDSVPVHLKDHTPGRMIVIRCSCGFTSSAPVSFIGTQRPCPKCGKKILVPSDDGSIREGLAE
ncbi:MAG TPA: hypothetical protein VFE62_27520 [Gemmataceae bacterium]|nr:hypothetical protein [Gemmataceae bacterium]